MIQTAMEYLGAIVMLSFLAISLLRYMASGQASSEEVAELILKAGDNEEAKKMVTSFMAIDNTDKWKSRVLYRKIHLIVNKGRAERIISEFNNNNNPKA